MYMVATYYIGSKVDDDSGDASESYGAIIAKRISIAVPVFGFVAICTLVLIVNIGHRKLFRRATSEDTQPVHTEIEESSFMESRSAPPLQADACYIASPVMDASIITDVPPNYETVEPQKLAKLNEEEFYSDMNSERHYNTDEEPPENHAIANYNAPYPVSLSSKFTKDDDANH